MDPLNPGLGLWNRFDRVAQVLGVDLFRRALVLERDGQITLMNSRWPGHDDSASVLVRGSGRPYFLTWRAEFDPLLEQLLSFRSQCECGSHQCEHAVSAWLRTRFQRDADLAQRWRAYGEPQAQGLTRTTNQWLASLDQPDTPSPRIANASDEVILYVLLPSKDQRYLDRIDTVKAKRLVKGGYSKHTKAFIGWSSLLPIQTGFTQYAYQRYSGYVDLHFIDDADRVLAKQLYIHDVLPVQGAINLAGHDLGHVLIDLVHTGRLVYGSHHGGPLTLGPERKASLHWHADPDGRWGLALAVTPATALIIATNPPWYVDSEAGCIGSLETGLPAAVLRAVFTAPAVNADELGPLTAALAGHGKLALALPTPPTLTTVDEGVVRPVPVLELTGMEEYSPFGGRAVTPVARLSFDYHGKRYGPGGSDRMVQTTGHIVTVQHRDRAFERDCRQQLARYHVVAASADDDVLLFEDGTLDDPVLRCLQFQQEAMADLQQQGWRIEFAHDFTLRLATTGEWQVTLEDAEPGWFDAALGVDIDGKRMDLVPLLRAMLADDTRFRAAVKDGRATSVWYYPLDGNRWLAVPAERVRQLASVLLELEHHSGRGRLRVSRFELAGLDDGSGLAGIRMRGAAEMQDLANALRNEPVDPPASLPPALVNRLRPYQRSGVAFLQGRLRHNMGVILADDMGLGKTVQVLSHILAEVLSGDAVKRSKNDTPAKQR